MAVSTFVSEYARLLITQYFSKPKARAETELTVGGFESAYEVMREFPVAFDVDNAIGVTLDKIGKIVGVPRTVPLVVAKIGFGFSENANARGFFDKFITAISAPFFDKFTPPYTDQQLNDYDYRLVIKARIAANNSSAFMVSDERISIQQVIQQAFDGQAYVVDQQNMSLALYITRFVTLDRLRLLVALKLLPKPHGVRYSDIVQMTNNKTFGFADNAQALGFDDTFTPVVGDGDFANKVFI